MLVLGIIMMNVFGIKRFPHLTTDRALLITWENPETVFPQRPATSQTKLNLTMET